MSQRLLAEVSALHRPLHHASWSVFADGTIFRLESSTPSWEFPVLAKYKFARSRIAPFIEAGPSFRLTQVVLTGKSAFGITAGAGVEGRVRGVTVAPRIRFTKWGRSGIAGDTFIGEKTDLLVGLTF